jgi:CheY-like chemotaxis protein
MVAKRILVVDDDPDIAALNAEFLRLRGYAAESCTAASDALRRLATEEYDALLTDLDVGGRGSGFILAGALKQMRPSAGVILLTGLPDFAAAWTTIQSFVDRTFVKPVHPESLETAVEWLAAPVSAPAPHLDLAGLIEKYRRDLVEEWLARAEADPLVAMVALSRKERLDDLEEVLAEVVANLRTPHRLTMVARAEAARRHGELRRRQGYATVAVLRESSLVRQTITELSLRRFWELNPERFLADLFAMNTSVDDSALRSLEGFGAP